MILRNLMNMLYVAQTNRHYELSILGKQAQKIIHNFLITYGYV